MRALRATVAIACALAIGACGGSSGGSSGSSSTAASTSTVTVTSASSSAATTSAGATTSASATANVPRCVAAGLRPGFLSQQGAAGHGVLVFSLRNASGQPCHTFGYPGVRFLALSGQPLPTSSVRTRNDIAGSAPLRALVLARGQFASFRLVVTHGAVPGSACSTASVLQVIAPDDTAVMRIAIPGGAYECGTATVTPLQPGNSAAG